MIVRKQFPLINTVLPFVFGIFGVFGLIYQEVNSAEHLKDSLIMYLVVVVEIIVLGVFMAWKTSDGLVANIVKTNNETIEEIKRFLDNKKK